MYCPSCKKDIKDGSEKCGHCGAVVIGNDHRNMLEDVHSGTVNPQASAAQQTWWKYSVFADKSISRLDQILFFVYIGVAFYMPISALLSLVVIRVIRKNNVNAVYTKTATIVIIFMAVFSMAANFIRQINR
jgi:ABC-type siderophore export system fused ATPase/permease subunit